MVAFQKEKEEDKDDDDDEGLFEGITLQPAGQLPARQELTPDQHCCQVGLSPAATTRSTLSQFKSLKIRCKTFLDCIKFVDGLF